MKLLLKATSALAVCGFFAQTTTGLKLGSSKVSQQQQLLQQREMWLSCDDFMAGLESLSKAAGHKPPRKLTTRSTFACTQLMHVLGRDHPNFVPAIINMGKFYESRSFDPMVSSKEIVPDVASDMIRRRRHRSSRRKLKKDDGTGDHEEISQCGDPEYGKDECPHDPCLPEFLIPADEFTDPTKGDYSKTYNEFDPDYGGCCAEMLLIDDVWSGNDVDRTNENKVGTILISSIAAVAAATLNEYICAPIEDDLVNKCVVPPAPLPVPNPAKIICHVFLAILQTTQLTLEYLLTLADYQDGGVDGAEIEAGYEHTKNLLQKQCAIYDQAVCRCVIEEHQESYGLGCDGKDSNCNDFVDECDEDVVPPVIVIDDSLCACNNGGWFANVTEAESCVENSMTISDDCQNTTSSVSGLDMCESSSVTIKAQDFCGNDAIEKTVPVQIDGEAPQVTCGFLQGSSSVTTLVVTADTTGPSVLMDSRLEYDATDNCNGPLNVTVKVYSNEIEDFNAQKLALFYKTADFPNDDAGLFVAKGICSTVKNGQCIKEDAFSEQRLYTVEVTAFDQAGLSNSTECYIEILPKGNTNLKGRGSILKDISESKQRFLLTTYSSIFN